MGLFINELSFNTQAKNEAGARRLMHDLIEVIRLLKASGNDRRVYSSQTLWKKEISAGFNVHQCLNKISVDKKRWFMAIVRKGPFVETILDERLQGFYQCVLKENNEDVSDTSIAGAVFFNGILASLSNCPGYMADKILVAHRIDDNDFSVAEVLNFFDSDAAKKYMLEMREVALDSVLSWDDLWWDKHELFPMLTFCHNVRKQLGILDFSPANGKIVKDHLHRMNRYCNERPADKQTIPEYDKMGILASVESESTLAKYGRQREFLCPDGKKRLFSWHTKQKGQNVRIHFYPPDGDNKDFIIGYIGRHLDTAKYH